MEQQERTQARPHIVLILGLVAVIALTALLFGRMRVDPLRGVWMLDSVTTYEFNGHGRGTLRSSSRDYTFRYKLKDTQLDVDFKSEDARDADYTITVDEYNLVLRSSTGRVYRLARQS